ncbi:MAG: electron transfer flavoprotein subunit beta/FixA family protein [Myxococcota bacterium]|nr:electron transfer flavoprotein subunit beta/FixA family protein [Myxococcota bacterium]MDW8361133.1 electron transfer flavoprotein subunit beta/FixA family protein [Myxococcales bacterium]
MKVLVSFKRVADPDNANKVKVAPDGSRVLAEGLEAKPNPFDDYAIEAALRLTENGKSGERLGEIVVVSIGPKEAAQTIRQALAMGAERGILVLADDEQLDAWVVARTLRVLVERERPDLVLLGKATVDGESGAVGGILAEMLGWPMSTLTCRIETRDGGKTFTVARELDTGVATLHLEGPAVVTVSDRILAPTAVRNGVTPDDFAYPQSDTGRYASLKGIMAAKKKPIEETSLQALGVDATPTCRYERFALPPARSGQVRFVESAAELVQRLRTEAKVL